MDVTRVVSADVGEGREVPQRAGGRDPLRPRRQERGGGADRDRHPLPPRRLRPPAPVPLQLYG